MHQDLNQLRDKADEINLFLHWYMHPAALDLIEQATLSFTQGARMFWMAGSLHKELASIMPMALGGEFLLKAFDYYIAALYLTKDKPTVLAKIEELEGELFAPPRGEFDRIKQRIRSQPQPNC